MRRLLPLLVLLALLFPARALADAYGGGLSGRVVDYRLSGVEPDGDPIDQVALQTTLAGHGHIPAMHLIISSYLENFQPDTTPVLPDLLHPKRTARNLGGFLEGKAMLTDDAGRILYLGTFLAEAFFDNRNHTVLRLDGQGPARGSFASLRGTFILRKDATLHGALSGTINLPPAARRDLLRARGSRLRPIKQILAAVTVHPAPMMGKSTKGNSHVVLHTGYGAAHKPTSGPHLSPLTLAAAAGALLSLLWAGILFWQEQRRKRRTE